MSDTNSLRLDKWLWAARFFKTRKLAAESISGGKIHLNKQRTKPGKEIKIGDQLSINKAGYNWDIAVTGINKQRRPASEAALLYEETAESRTKRQQRIIEQKEKNALLDHSERECKPTKKQRRQIHRFVRS